VDQGRLSPALPGVGGPQVSRPALSMEGSGPRWAEPIKGEPAPIRGVPLAAVMTMMPMRVLVEKFLCQGLMSRDPTLECLSVRCLWVPMATSYCARPLGSVASQGLGLGHLPDTGEPRGTTAKEGCNMPGRAEVHND
jgi:hypothetical protein